MVRSTFWVIDLLIEISRCFKLLHTLSCSTAFLKVDQTFGTGFSLNWIRTNSTGLEFFIVDDDEKETFHDMTHLNDPFNDDTFSDANGGFRRNYILQFWIMFEKPELTETLSIIFGRKISDHTTLTSLCLVFNLFEK